MSLGELKQQLVTTAHLLEYTNYTNAGKDVEQQELPIHCRGNANDTDTSDDSLEVSYKTEHSFTPDAEDLIIYWKKGGVGMGSSKKELWTWMSRTKFQDLPC